MPIPLAPEQRKTAKIIPTWDKATTTTGKQIANRKQQKKAIMQKLLTAKKRLVGFFWDWGMAKFLQMINIVMEASPKSSVYNELQHGMPLLRSNADIKNRKFTPRSFASKITKECFVNDTLLSDCVLVGKVAKSNHHACIERGVAEIAATKDHSQEFIYQCFLDYKPKWECLFPSRTSEAVNSNDIKSLNMLILPLIEQKPPERQPLPIRILAL